MAETHLMFLEGSRTLRGPSSFYIKTPPGMKPRGGAVATLLLVRMNVDLDVDRLVLVFQGTSTFLHDCGRAHGAGEVPVDDRHREHDADDDAERQFDQGDEEGAAGRDPSELDREPEQQRDDGGQDDRLEKASAHTLPCLEEDVPPQTADHECRDREYDEMDEYVLAAQVADLECVVLGPADIADPEGVVGREGEDQDRQHPSPEDPADPEVAEEPLGRDPHAARGLRTGY